MDDELMTAATFGDHTQAVVVRGVLEEAGIPAFLVGEWMSQGLFVVGGVNGGVRVLVPSSRCLRRPAASRCAFASLFPGSELLAIDVVPVMHWSFADHADHQATAPRLRSKISQNRRRGGPADLVSLISGLEFPLHTLTFDG